LRREENAKRLAVFCGRAASSEKVVAAAGEKFFGGGGVDGERDFEAFGFVESGVCEIHGGWRRLRAMRDQGMFHGSGIGNDDDAEGAGRAKGLPASANVL